MKTIPGLSLFTILLTVSLTVSATDVRVRVFDRNGKTPLANAAVCLGTSARIDQFGASLTDRQGYASFSAVPRAPLVVTVSREGYKAEQESLVVSSTSRMLMMSLSTGGGGTPCPLGDTTAKVYDNGLGISRFALNNGQAVTTARKVTLDNHVNGQPTQYRASERSDFRGSGWHEYSTAPVFELSPGSGTRRVYFQVRRHAAAGGANIETLSPVVRDSITLQ